MLVDSLPLPTELVLPSLTALIVTFLALLLYRPAIDKNAPTFTSDTMPIVGSWAFFSRRWKFWNAAVKQSHTGNFSFWLGRNHVIAVSGERARKLFLDNRNLDFIYGNKTLLGLGPDIGPVSPIFTPGPKNGPSHFQVRLIDFMKADQLAKRLPNVVRDARIAVQALAKDQKGITNPFTMCYPVVVAQSTRVLCTDEIPDTPTLMKTLLDILVMLSQTCDRHAAAVPWLPSWHTVKRWNGRRRLRQLVTPLVDKRFQHGGHVDDALQFFIDHGDKREQIIDFFISILFISTTNAAFLNGLMLNIMAHDPEWQNKIVSEIKAALGAHATNKNQPVLDRLATLPLEVWESAFPSIDLCYKEAIRVYAAFPMFRKNVSQSSIPIPGTKEVIPAGSYVAYNTTDVHYNESIYPRPQKFEPERFDTRREDFNKQQYGFVGWGHGRHPCLGQRWAKLQQTIMLVHALAVYEWTGCDVSGNPIPPMDPPKDVDVATPSLPQGIYCKYVARTM